MKKFLIILIAILPVLTGCKQGRQSDNTKQKQNNSGSVKKTAANSPDSIVLTVSTKGKRDRMSFLQQKVLMKAKNQLGDSIATLQQIFADTTHHSGNTGSAHNYEVELSDIRVLDEGFRYPEPENQKVIEAYITVGIQYKKPVTKIQRFQN